MNVYKDNFVVYGGQTRDMANTVVGRGSAKLIQHEVFLFDIE
jgi:hypothetical protein